MEGCYEDLSNPMDVYSDHKVAFETKVSRNNKYIDSKNISFHKEGYSRGFNNFKHRNPNMICNINSDTPDRRDESFYERNEIVKKVKFDMKKTCISFMPPAHDSDHDDHNTSQENIEELKIEEVRPNESEAPSQEAKPKPLEINKKEILAWKETYLNKTPLQSFIELFPPPRFNICFKEINICQCHPGKYQYIVQVGCLRAFGLGNSKKEAKHAAAESALRQWNSVSIETLEKSPFCLNKSEGSGCKSYIGGINSISSSTNESEMEEFSCLTEKFQNMSVKGESIQGNSVGALQEYCVKNNIKPPIYEFSYFGDGANFYHVSEVEAVDKKEKGFGRTKKAAKHDAAHKILKLLLSHSNVT